MAYDRSLAAEMRALMAGRPGVIEKAMFGGRSWMLNGNMVCGVGEARFMFRVGKDRMAEALARNGAEPVVFGDKTMGGFVWVDPDAALEDGLDDWIAFAWAFAASLPPK